MEKRQYMKTKKQIKNKQKQKNKTTITKKPSFDGGNRI